MRSFFYASALFMCAFNSTAQTNPPRLIAEMQYGYNGTTYTKHQAFDYTYTGIKGWDSLLNRWKYAAKTPLNPTTYPGTRYIQTFDADENILSYEEQTYDSHNGYSPFFRQDYTYANGKLESITSAFSGSSPKQKLVYGYNSAGMLNTETVLEQNSQQGWDTTHRHLHYYTGNLEDSVIRQQYWPPVWTPYMKIYKTYDLSGNILSNVTMNYQLGEWDSTEVSTYTYTGNKLTTMDYLYYQTVGYDTSRFLYSYNNAGDTESEIEQHITNGTANNFQRTLKEYNAHHQIKKTTLQSWRNNNWENESGIKMTQYFYEGDDLGVPKASMPADIQLYPVPATHTLTIALNNAAPAAYTFAITAMDGRLVRVWNEPRAKSNYKEQVQVGELPAGNYLLRVSSNGAEMTRQFSIVR